MRIISQRGGSDFQYERFCLSITSDNKIVATKGLCASPNTILNSIVAEYSTRNKADKAMEMLHAAYCEHGRKVWQFPADDKVEE